MKNKQKSQIKLPENKLLKLDFGSGPNKRDGFLGVDKYSFSNVDFVCDLAEPIYVPLPAEFAGIAGAVERKIAGWKKWPWDDNSVEEAHTSHFVEHLTSVERCHFVNELYRVLIPGGKCSVIVPHWCSCRAYGDPTHKWSAVSEFWFFYLNKDWRNQNAPHTAYPLWPPGFKCDFDVTWGWGLHQALLSRNEEFQQDAAQWKKEAIQDMYATFTAKK